MKARVVGNTENLLSNVTRRDFMKFCTAIAATMGLPMTAVPQIAEAVTSPKRPSVIWLSAQECTGCVETLLRPGHPTLDTLILDLISLDYSETLNVGAGHQAEAHREKTIAENKGKFILVVDGAIPVKDGGVYCMVAGKPVLQILNETAPLAAAVIALGSCAAWGGVAAASPNPTGATPVHEILKDKKIPVVNIPGCPPNPYNFLSTVIHYLTFGKLPALDSKGRPKFAYDRLIHENCERRPHFDAGRFAEEFGDTGHRRGRHRRGRQGRVDAVGDRSRGRRGTGAEGGPPGGHGPLREDRARPLFRRVEHDRAEYGVDLVAAAAVFSASVAAPS